MPWQTGIAFLEWVIEKGAPPHRRTGVHVLREGAYANVRVRPVARSNVNRIPGHRVAVQIDCWAIKAAVELASIAAFIKRLKIQRPSDFVVIVCMLRRILLISCQEPLQFVRTAS